MQQDETCSQPAAAAAVTTALNELVPPPPTPVAALHQGPNRDIEAIETTCL